MVDTGNIYYILYNKIAVILNYNHFNKKDSINKIRRVRGFKTPMF
jgi:hypothetical protein